MPRLARWTGTLGRPPGFLRQLRKIGRRAVPMWRRRRRRWPPRLARPETGPQRLRFLDRTRRRRFLRHLRVLPGPVVALRPTVRYRLVEEQEKTRLSPPVQGGDVSTGRNARQGAAEDPQKHASSFAKSS